MTNFKLVNVTISNVTGVFKQFKIDGSPQYAIQGISEFVKNKSII